LQGRELCSGRWIRAVACLRLAEARIEVVDLLLQRRNFCVTLDDLLLQVRALALELLLISLGVADIAL
jgi:hypothetical protein